MKIYLIVGDNGMSYEDHSHWNVKAFENRKEAEEYIVKLNESFQKFLEDLEKWRDSDSSENTPYPQNKLDKNAMSYMDLSYKIEKIDFGTYNP